MERLMPALDQAVAPLVHDVIFTKEISERDVRPARPACLSVTHVVPGAVLGPNEQLALATLNLRVDVDAVRGRVHGSSPSTACSSSVGQQRRRAWPTRGVAYSRHNARSRAVKRVSST
jgi:hypothetical protein